MPDAGDNKTGQGIARPLNSPDRMNEMATDPPTKPATGLLSAYQRGSGAFDEMLSPEGLPLPHYTALISALEQLGLAELNRRRDTSQWLVREQGISYNVYGDPSGMEQPWQLDPIPFVIAPEEW